MGGVLCVVTTLHERDGYASATSKMYTIEGDVLEHGGLVEVLGELQRLIGESTP
jgi:hypothetical protein